MDSYSLRHARLGELDAILEIEDRAGRLYGEVGMDPDMPGLRREALQEGLDSETLWVVHTTAGELVGFALAWPRPGALHLREIDVVPEHGRRGLGVRLLDRTEAGARARRLPQVTLTTFTEVPWNAPFYRRHGFRDLEVEAWPAWLADIRALEKAENLDRWPRIAMAKAVPLERHRR